MKLNIEQLERDLEKRLFPVYLLSGDEPLQLMEAADLIRAKARDNGHNSREIYEVNREFKWDQLMAAASEMSLFADKRIIELRVPSGNVGKDGGAALVEYMQRPAEDAVLLIIAGKIEKRSQSSKWFKAIDAIGAVMQAWPIKVAYLPQWIVKRMASRGLQIDQMAAKNIAERVEGNLLAAAQEVEKLSLLYGSAGNMVKIDQRQITDAVADSTRYSVYDLVDSALSGHAQRTVKILNGLKSEGVATTLVLWAVMTEVRKLNQFAMQIKAGKRPEQVVVAVWDSRKPLVLAALKRVPAKALQILLNQCAHVDQVIKGVKRGIDWDELLHLVLGLVNPAVIKKTR